MSELYEEVIRRQQQDERQFRLSVANEQQVDHQRAARIFAVSAATDLPDEVVDADLDNLEGLVKRNDFSPENYTDEVNGSPVFNEFAAENPYHLSVLERNRRSLTRMERALEPLFQSWDAGWAMSEIAEIGVRQRGGDIRPEDAENLKELRALVGGGHFGVDNKFAKMFTGLAKQLPIQAWLLGESAESAMLGGVGGATIGGVMAGPPGMAAGFGTGIAAGLWAGRTEAAMRLEGGLMFDEAQHLGLDTEQAKVASQIHGVLGGLMESFGATALTKRLPGFRQIQRDAAGEVVARVFAKPQVSHAVARLSAHYGEALGTEIITEIGQEVSNMVGMEYLKSQAREAGDKRPETEPVTQEQFFDMLEQTIVETIYGAGILAGMGPVSQFYSESKQAYKAERLQHVWKTMGESAKDTELRETAPSKYEEFVNRLTDSGRYKEIQIGAEQFDTYFQEQGIDPDEMAQTLGVSVDEISEARQLGGSIEIPVGTYLKLVAATEHHAALTPHLKTDGGISMAEAELFRKNYPEQVKALEKIISGDEQVAEFDEQLKQDVAGQLVAAGHSAGTAESLATMILGLPNLARRAGMDPRALTERFFGGIRRATPEALEGVDIDVALDPLLNILRTGKGAPKKAAVRGVTLLDFLKKEGGLLDQGGELAARDLQLEMPGIVSKRGMELDKAAELAAEAGYIEAHDISLLMDAIDREQRGEAGPGMGANMEAVARQQDLDTLEELVGMAGIDLNEITDNAVVRAKLEAMDTLSQDRIKEPKFRGDPGQTVYEGPAYRAPGFEGGAPRGASAADVIVEEMERKGIATLDEFGIDDATFDALQKEPASSVTWVGRSRESLLDEYGPVFDDAGTQQYAGLITDPDDIQDVSKLTAGKPVLHESPDGTLVWTGHKKGDSKTFFQEEALTEYLVRQVEEVQDFGDLTITEDKTVQGTGQTVKVSQAASTKFDRAVKRRNVAKQLMDCISA